MFDLNDRKAFRGLFQNPVGAIRGHIAPYFIVFPSNWFPIVRKIVSFGTKRPPGSFAEGFDTASP